MATRSATLTVTHSSNPATAHLGPFFADLRIGGKQATTTGTAEHVRNYINKRYAEATKHGVTLIVKDETYQKDFTARGGLIDTPYSD